MKTMPWKNGQGATTEVAIEPPQASFLSDGFSWRLSSAKIHAANQFSLFPGYDRLLTVWKGSGLILNGSKLGPFKTVQFRGEEQISCELIHEAVQDLGLIYKRDRLRAEMEVLTLMGRSKQIYCGKGPGTNLWFCAHGSVTVNGCPLQEGDALRIHGPTEAKVCARDTAILLIIKIMSL
jgi:environmental stress-induced protein Ves